MKWIFIFLLGYLSQAFGFQHQQTNAKHHVFSELLVWQFHAESDESWGQMVPVIGQTQNQDLYLLNIPFKYVPGFRVGATYLNDEAMDIKFHYTWYQTQGKNQASGRFLHSAFNDTFYVNNTDGSQVLGAIYTNGSAQWNLQYHSLDIELGHQFQYESLITHPYAGLKAGIINQSIISNWYNPYHQSQYTPLTSFSSIQEIIHNNFWGMGPSFGVDIQIILDQHANRTVDLYGNLAGALLWGNWKLTDEATTNLAQQITTLNDSVNSGTPMLTSKLGVELQLPFKQGNLSTRLGYEGQVWFNQLRYYSYNMGRLNNQISFQGGTLEFNLAF